MFSTLPIFFLLVLEVVPQLEVLAAPSAAENRTLAQSKRSGNCPLKFQGIPGHTACLDGRSQSVVSSSEKQFIVNKHNQYRAAASPTASQMMHLAWDDEVAMVAQKWADNCDFNHDDQRLRDIPGGWILGQNLALGSPNWNDAISRWHNEVHEFTYGGPNPGSEHIGHYTTMMWDRTTHIGCGVARCNSGSLYVCNYAPGGNFDWLLDTPYKRGSSCGDCSGHCNNKLCDCGANLKCYNDATVDLHSCTCQCPDINGLYSGRNCALNCGRGDDWFCADQGRCPGHASHCPHKCGYCPAGSGPIG